MAILNNTDFETMQSNSSVKAELDRKLLSIESQTIAWMAEAVALHSTSHADDKPTILAMRADLIAKLTAATTI